MVDIYEKEMEEIQLFRESITTYPTNSIYIFALEELSRKLLVQWVFTYLIRFWQELLHDVALTNDSDWTHWRKQKQYLASGPKSRILKNISRFTLKLSELSMVTHIYNSSTWEAEAKGSLQVQGQLNHSETLYQKVYKKCLNHR